MLKELFIETISDKLVGMGFVRNKDRWNLFYDGSIIVIEIQYSKITNALFINFGISYLNPNVKKKVFKIDDCYFIGRYNQIIQSNNTDDVWIFLDRSTEEIKKKVEDVANKIENLILPYLKKLGNRNYVINSLSNITSENRLWLQKITSAELLDILRPGASL